jgi:hypothetical protein
MHKAMICRKRPCRICRRWFTPNPRLKDRQKTCGDAQCKKEWHRKKCSEWNKKNTDYFRTNYLDRKLDAASPSEKASKILPIKSRLKSGLPLAFVQEVIDIQHLIIIEYLAQLLVRRFQEVLRDQVVVNTRYIRQQSPLGISRGDRHSQRLLCISAQYRRQGVDHDKEENP